ncbi:endonuclease domain-containing protein [Desertihabitans brevis]|nr:DUF559 domain-containing protein [Desertihabitans brevis]
MRVPDVVKAGTLLGMGLPRRELEALVAGGAYRRIGGGWLVSGAASSDVVSALTRGTRLTCLSAAKAVGLWTPPFEGVHVYVRRGCDTPPPYRGHRPEPRCWPDRSPIAPVPLLLQHSLRCAGTETAAILLESAWNLGILDAAGVADVVGRLPSKPRTSLSRLRGDAQSGTETRVRRWLESRRVRVRAQVTIRGVGRVDLLVGDRWVVECDSVAHHTGVESYARDRRRDLELQRLGYVVTRLSWEQVFLEWEATRQALTEILRRGEHRRKVLMASDQVRYGLEGTP